MIYLKCLKDELPLIWFCLWRQKNKEGESGGEGAKDLARERQGKGGRMGANIEGERDRDRRTDFFLPSFSEMFWLMQGGHMLLAYFGPMFRCALLYPHCTIRI